MVPQQLTKILDFRYIETKHSHAVDEKTDEKPNDVADAVDMIYVIDKWLPTFLKLISSNLNQFKPILSYYHRFQLLLTNFNSSW